MILLYSTMGFKKEFETKLRLNNLSHLYLFHDPVEVAAIPSYAKLANAMFLSLKKHDVFSKTIPNLSVPAGCSLSYNV